MAAGLDRLRVARWGSLVFPFVPALPFVSWDVIDRPKPRSELQLQPERLRAESDFSSSASLEREGPSSAPMRVPVRSEARSGAETGANTTHLGSLLVRQERRPITPNPGEALSIARDWRIERLEAQRMQRFLWAYGDRSRRSTVSLDVSAITKSLCVNRDGQHESSMLNIDEMRSLLGDIRRSRA